MLGQKILVCLGGIASVISALGLLSSFGLWDLELLWGATLAISLIVLLKSYNKLVGGNNGGQVN